MNTLKVTTRPVGYKVWEHKKDFITDFRISICLASKTTCKVSRTSGTVHVLYRQDKENTKLIQAYMNKTTEQTYL